MPELSMSGTDRPAGDEAVLLHVLNTSSDADLSAAFTAVRLESANNLVAKISTLRLNSPIASLGALRPTLTADEAAHVIDALAPIAAARRLPATFTANLLHFANTGGEGQLPSLTNETREAIRRSRLARDGDFTSAEDLMRVLPGDVRDAVVAGSQIVPPASEKLPGLGDVEAIRLRELGIGDAAALAATTFSAVDRAELASVSGVAETRLAKAGTLAAVTLVPGISEAHAALLRDAGIDSPSSLAQVDPEQLQRRLTMAADVAGVSIAPGTAARAVEHARAYVNGANGETAATLGGPMDAVYSGTAPRRPLGLPQIATGPEPLILINPRPTIDLVPHEPIVDGPAPAPAEPQADTDTPDSERFIPPSRAWTNPLPLPGGFIDPIPGFPPRRNATPPRIDPTVVDGPVRSPAGESVAAPPDVPPMFPGGFIDPIPGFDGPLTRPTSPALVDGPIAVDPFVPRGQAWTNPLPPWPGGFIDPIPGFPGVSTQPITDGPVASGPSVTAPTDSGTAPGTTAPPVRARDRAADGSLVGPEPRFGYHLAVTPRSWWDGVLVDPFPGLGEPLLDPEPVWPRLEEVPRPFGVFICALPFVPMWWGPLWGTTEPAQPPKGKKGPPPAKGGAIELDKPTAEEQSLIDAAHKQLQDAKNAEDSLQRQRHRRKQKRIRKKRKLLQREKDKRKDKKEREKREREKKLTDDRKKLDERWKANDDERKRLEQQQKDIQQRDQDLRNQEQNLRQDDPNCQTPPCQQVREDRAANQQDRYDNMRATDANARDAQRLGQDERAWQQDARQFRDDVNSGKYDSTDKDRHDRLERQQRDKVASLQDKADQIQQNLARLDSLGRPLTAQEQQAHDALVQQLQQTQSQLGTPQLQALNDAIARQNAAQDALQRAQGSGSQEDIGKANLELSDANAAVDKAQSDWAKTAGGQYTNTVIQNACGKPEDPNDPYTSQDARDARAMSHMSDDDLNRLDRSLAKADADITRAIDDVGHVGAQQNVPNDARAALDAADQAARDAEARAQGLQGQIDGLQSTLNSIRDEKSRVLDELHQRGYSQYDGTINGSPQEQAEIQNLRDTYHGLEQAEANTQSQLRSATLDHALAQDALEGPQQARMQAEPAAIAEQVRADVGEYNKSLGDNFDANGNATPAADAKMLDMMRGLEHWEGLNHESDRLKKAVAGGDKAIGDPGGSVTERRDRLTPIEAEKAGVEKNLNDQGLSRDSGAWKVDPKNPLAVAIGRALHKAHEDYVAKQADEDKKKHAEEERRKAEGKADGKADVRPAQTNSPPTPAERFGMDGLGLPRDHPVTALLRDIEAQAGANVVDGYLASRSASKDGQSAQGVDVIDGLFDDKLIPDAASRNDWTTVTRLRQRHVEALTKLRAGLPPMPTVIPPSTDLLTTTTYAAIRMVAQKLDASLGRALRALSEAYGRLADEAQRNGDTGRAAALRTLSIAAAARRDAATGAQPDPKATMDRLDEASSTVLDDALAAGDVESAEELLRARIEAATVILQAATERQQTVDNAVLERIAKDLVRLAAVLDARAATEDPATATKTRTEAMQTRLVAASHQLAAGNIAGAAGTLTKVEPGSDDKVRAWKVALLSQAIMTLNASSAATKDDADKARGRALLMRLCTALGETSADVNVRCSMLLTRAQIHEDQGDAAAAEKLRMEAASIAPSNPAVISLQLQALLKEKTRDRDFFKRLVEILSHATEPFSSRADAFALTSLLSGGITFDQLVMLEEALTASTTLPPKRKARLLLDVGLTIAGHMTASPSSLIDLPPRRARLQALLADADLTDEQRTKTAEQIDKLGPGTAYLTGATQAFRNGTMPTADMPRLMSAALQTGDETLFKQVLQAYVARTDVNATARLQMLAAFAWRLTAVAQNIKDANARARVKGWIDLIRAQGATIGSEEDAAIRDGFAAEYAEQRKLASTLTGGETSVAWIVLFGIGGWWYRTTRNANYTEALAANDASRARLAALNGRARALAMARLQLQLVGRDAASASIVAAQLAAQASAAHRAAEANAEQTWQGFDKGLAPEGTLDDLDKNRAAIALASIFDDIAMETSLDLAGGPHTGEAEIQNIEDQLEDKGWPGMNRGWQPALRHQLEDMRVNPASERLFYGKTGYVWRMTLLSDKIAQLEQRREHLVISGPIRDANGVTLTGQARYQRLVKVMNDEIKAHLREADRYRDDPLDWMTRTAKTEEARAKVINDYIKSRPELRAFQRLADLPTLSTPDAFRALAFALDTLSNERADEFAKYVDPSYKTGIDQWNKLLWYVLNMDEGDPAGITDTTRRLQNFRDRVRTLSDALRAAADGQKLSKTQHGLLVLYSFIASRGPGSTESYVVPAGLHLSSVEEGLDLPKRTAWDELVNPANALKLVATILVPMYAAEAVTGFVVGELLLDSTLGGDLLGAAINGLTFTAASRAGEQIAAAALGEDVPDHVFAKDVAHNLVIFTTLGIVGRAVEGILGVALEAWGGAATAERWAAAIKAAQMATEAATLTGLDALQGGESPSVDAFLRQLVMLSFIHTARKAADTYGPLVAARVGAVDSPTAGLRDLSAPDAPGAAATRAELAPIKEALRTRPSDPARTSADYDAIEARLRAARIDVIEHGALRRERAGLIVTPDGRMEIHIDKGTTRSQVYNELVKIEELARLGVDSSVPITSQVQAAVEVASYEAEFELYRDQPMTPAQAEVLGKLSFWRERLNAIMVDGAPNLILYGSFEGFALGHTNVVRLSETLRSELMSLGIKDPTAPEYVSSLRDASQELIDFYVERVNRAEGERNRLAGRIADARVELNSLRDDFSADADAKRAKLKATIDRLEIDTRDLDARINRGLQRAVDILEGVKRATSTSRTVDIKARRSRTPTFSDPADRAAYENLRQDYETLSQAADALAAQYDAAVDANNTALADSLEAQLQQNIQSRINISKELGGLAADAAIKNMFPNAKKLPLESADGGGGAGEVDAVWEVVPGKFIVVEAKGGSADIGAADSAGFYAEQGTLAHTLITASKMILRASTIEATNPQRAQALRAAGEAIFEAYKQGTLEVYIAKTKWIEGPNRTFTVDQTNVYKVELEWTEPGKAPSRSVPQEIRMPGAPQPPGAVRLGRIRLTPDGGLDVRSDGVRTDLPQAKMDQLLRAVDDAVVAGDLAIDASGAHSSALVALPARTVRLDRADGHLGAADIEADPAFARFKEEAAGRAVNLILGVAVVGPGGVRVDGALFFRPDGSVTFLGSNAHVSIGGRDIVVVVGDAARTAPQSGSPTLVLGDAASSESLVGRFQRGIGVEDVGQLSPTTIDFVDLYTAGAP